jgi:hypothetical protein
VTFSHKDALFFLMLSCLGPAGCQSQALKGELRRLAEMQRLHGERGLPVILELVKVRASS